MTGVRLAFEGVACLRGQRLVFEGLTFALGPGDAALVNGPNGIGKSSLLRLAAGLLAPAVGRIVHEGRLALADENLALDRHRTLGSALDFWAMLDAGDSATGMDAFGLTHLAPVPVRMLSTGQRKRATLARVVASGAAIWLLDEPANGLDTDSVDRLGAAMAAHRAAGGIVLAASHQPLDLADARQIDLTRRSGSPGIEA